MDKTKTLKHQNTRTPEQFNAGFERCINDPRFLDRFYSIFISSSDEVDIKFKDTDMEIQKVVLMTSLAYMTRAYNNESDLLSETAEKHNINNLNIKPHLYSLWLDSLVAAAKGIDPLFDINTEKLWRKILQPGIDLMVSRYNDVL